VPVTSATGPQEGLAPSSAARPVIIRASGRWRGIDLPELWQFRDVLRALALRDLKLRYRQTVLGVTWVLLQPLIASGIFAFVFGRVAGLSSGGTPYFLFAYAGLLGWNAFSDTVTRATTSLVGNQAMISKIYFPRLLLPLSTGAAAIVNFAVSAVVLVVLIVGYDEGLRPQMVLLPLWLLGVLLLATGLGLLGASTNVVYRDVGHAMPVIVQLLLYASPVAYALDQVPESLRPYLAANPMTGLLEAFRWSAFGSDVQPGYVAWSFACGVGALICGALVFRRMERRFADVI
jgi:lipopolysaccharide transport system permease protein